MSVFPKPVLANHLAKYCKTQNDYKNWCLVCKRWYKCLYNNPLVLCNQIIRELLPTLMNNIIKMRHYSDKPKEKLKKRAKFHLYEVNVGDHWIFIPDNCIDVHWITEKINSNMNISFSRDFSRRSQQYYNLVMPYQYCSSLPTDPRIGVLNSKMIQENGTPVGIRFSTKENMYVLFAFVFPEE